MTLALRRPSLETRIEDFSAPVIETMYGSGLDIERTQIVGSGVLACAGIRLPGDVDVLVAPEVFDSLYNKRHRDSRYSLKPGTGNGDGPSVLTASIEGLPLTLDIMRHWGEGARERFEEGLEESEPGPGGLRLLPLAVAEAGKRSKIWSAKAQKDVALIALARHRGEIR